MESSAQRRAQAPLLAHFTLAATTTPPAGSSGPAPSTLADESPLPPPARPADSQAASPFFSRLPSEIRRMIYVEVWRTYGSGGYDSKDGKDDGDNGRHPQQRKGSAAGSGLTPHITASLPMVAWTSPSENAAQGGGGTVGWQRPWQRPSLDRDPPVYAFTSAPCFLAVDDDGDDDGDDGGGEPRALSSRRRRLPPEAFDVRPQRLAAAHTDDLDAATTRNGGSSNHTEDGPTWQSSSSLWRARWNSPWLGHWACEEYFTGAARGTGNAHSGGGGSSSSGGGAAGGDDGRRRRPPLRRPYLPVLLTCRRAYVEGIDLLYSTLTFQFTEMATAQRFLERWPCVASVRLVTHLSTSLLDFYRHAGEENAGIITGSRGEAAAPLHNNNNNTAPAPAPAPVTTTGTFPRHDVDHRDQGTGVPPVGDGRGGGGGGGAHKVVNARHNAWQSLCAGLAADQLPNLRRLHVWVEAHDLRGWHKAAAETRLFAKLLEAGGGGAAGSHDSGAGDIDDGDGTEKTNRVTAPATRRRLTPENFVLYLPTLPADPTARGLPGCYLGGEEEEEATAVTAAGSNPGSSRDDGTRRPQPPLPCTIVRTERPDYWDVHLNMRPVFVTRRVSIGSRLSVSRRTGLV